MKQEEFKTARHDNITQEQADRMTFEQQRIIKLEERVLSLEQQLLVALKFIRREAEKRNEEMAQQLVKGTAAKA